ncbi:hypothetical protein [Thiomonas sp.]
MAANPVPPAPVRSMLRVTLTGANRRIIGSDSPMDDATARAFKPRIALLDPDNQIAAMKA